MMCVTQRVSQLCNARIGRLLAVWVCKGEGGEEGGRKAGSGNRRGWPRRGDEGDRVKPGLTAVYSPVAPEKHSHIPLHSISCTWTAAAKNEGRQGRREKLQQRSRHHYSCELRIANCDTVDRLCALPCRDKRTDRTTVHTPEAHAAASKAATKAAAASVQIAVCVFVLYRAALSPPRLQRHFKPSINGYRCGYQGAVASSARAE